MAVKAIPWKAFADRVVLRYETLREHTTTQRIRQILEILARIEVKGKPAVKTTKDLNQDLVMYFIKLRRSGLPADRDRQLLDPTVRGRPTLNGVCDNTIIGELGYLKAICSLAFDWDGLERIPFKPRERLLKPESLKRLSHLTIDQAGAYLDFLERSIFDWRGHRLFALVSLYLYTGIRRSEGLWLWAEDVDLELSVIHLVERDKTFKTVGSAQPVGCPPELGVSLSRWLPRRGGSPYAFPGVTGVGPWTGGSAGYKPLDRVKATAEQAGFPGVTIQMFRHTWTTNAQWWGVSKDEAQDQLRHADVKTQRHYRHEDLLRRAAAVRNVSFRGRARKLG
jgi:integrase